MAKSKDTCVYSVTPTNKYSIAKKGIKTGSMSTVPVASVKKGNSKMKY